MRWDDLTAVELRARAAVDDVVLVPVGAIEQHGPHLPVDTDIRLATAAAGAAAGRRDGIVIAPGVPFGLSPLHVPFGGTITLRVDTQLQVLRDVAASIEAAGFRRMVFVNGHNSNKPALALLASELISERRVAIGVATYYELAQAEVDALRDHPHPGMDHAGEIETSMMLHVAPGLVKLDKLDGVTPGAELGANRELLGAAGQIGFWTHDRFASGIIGDPSGASAEKGRDAFEASVNALVGFIDTCRKVA